MTAAAMILCINGFCQEETWHFRYNFKTAAYIQLAMLSKETKVFESNIIWHTVRDKRFMLIFLEEVETVSDIEEGIKKENWNDTLLFDFNTFRMYSAMEKKSYLFNATQLHLNSSGKYVSLDTLIDCSAKAHYLANPSPTLFANRGISVYKTGRFTFNLASSEKCGLRLPTFYERYKKFAFSPRRAPFAY